MIELSKAYVTSDGSTFSDLKKAQAHEICTLSLGINPADVDKLLSKSEELVDILTMKPNSRPKARKIHKKKSTKNGADANPESKV